MEENHSVDVHVHALESGEKVVALVLPSTALSNNRQNLPPGAVALTPADARALAQALLDAALLVKEA